VSGSNSDLKAQTRSEMRSKLKALSTAEALRKGARIQEKVIQWPLFEKAKALGLYAAYRNEVETRLIFEWARKTGKRVAYPRVTDAGLLEFSWIDSFEELVKTPLGPLTPRLDHPPAPLSGLELILVPGLAFDDQGRRLGRGKGFYDRTLAQFKGVSLGLAYSFQVVPRLPQDPWDEGVQWVATESNFFQIPSFRSRDFDDSEGKGGMP